jgi:dienelactone hydrolase
MKRSFIIAVVLVLLVAGPVLIRQVAEPTGRSVTGVSLRDTHYIEIDFHNAEQDLELAGMLFVPPGTGPFPAVVMIHGSGTSVRDNAWYLTLAHDLQQHGVVVLLPDKRGSEKSQGDWRSASLDDLATDTLAAVQYLKTQGAAPVGKIGVIGMSQGGWIAPLVANRSSDVAFIVSFSGAAVTPVEQLRYEEDHNLRQLGFLPGVSHVIALMSTTWIRKIAQTEFWDAIGDFDPLPYWGQLRVDAFVLLGAEDTNVPAEESRARLQSLDNRQIRIKIYEDSGHALASPAGIGNSIIREDAREDIRRFIASSVAGT